MKIIIILLFISLIYVIQKGIALDKYHYHDFNLPIGERINDLISQLTFEEKASQMMNNSAAIPRQGIPQYAWWNEVLHRFARSGVAAIFPQVIAMGATFDNELISRVSTTISDEARANYNVVSLFLKYFE